MSVPGVVSATSDNGGMSDEGNGLHVRQSPRKRNEERRVSDLTVMVRVPGRPAAVRLYADDEADEAARYAAKSGGVVVALPLAPPAAYVRGPDGSLLPERGPATDLGG